MVRKIRISTWALMYRNFNHSTYLHGYIFMVYARGRFIQSFNILQEQNRSVT